MASTQPGSTTGRNVEAGSAQGQGASSRPGSGQQGTERPIPPAAHYLFALLITLIVTGLAFPIEDEGTKWIVFTVGVIMDLSILLAWAIDASSRRRQVGAARRR